MNNSAFITLNFAIALFSLLIFCVGLTIFIIKFKKVPSLSVALIFTLLSLDFLITFSNVFVA